ncbi:glycosyltransferase [Maioricimonas sp. JC845]|uniref:glycosyltransferase n=1 Tax=Maioricimonas sp. JC845 TaxID=3232138 RepID=UPI003457780C
MPVPHPVASDSPETGAVPDASLPSATPVTDAPRASVIICVYNRARQVLPCLESLLASTFDDFEIVLVDDASTDESPEVLARYRDDHPERSIRIVRNEINKGISGARNAGIDAARGELVFFTDSDCTVKPDWLQQMVAVFDDDAVSAVAGTVVDPPPRNWAEMARFGGSRIGRHPLQGRRLIGGNMGFRRSIVMEHRFDPEIRYGCDEDDLARRLAAAGHRFGFAPDAIVHHHHPFTIGSYLRLAWKQGRGSAHFWRKHGMVLGRDLWFLLAAVLTLPAAWFGMPAALLPGGFLALQCAALLYNSLAFKGQPPGTALLALPLQLVHSAVKLASVVSVRLFSPLQGRQVTSNAGIPSQARASEDGGKGDGR